MARPRGPTRDHSPDPRGAALAWAVAAALVARDARATEGPTAAPSATDAAASAQPPAPAPADPAAVAYLRDALRVSIAERDHEQVFRLTERLRALHALGDRPASLLAEYLLAAERYAAAWAVSQWCTRAVEPAARARCRSVAERAALRIAWIFPDEARAPSYSLPADWRETRTREAHALTVNPTEGDVVYLGGFVVARAGRALIELAEGGRRSERYVELVAGQSVYVLRPPGPETTEAP